MKSTAILMFLGLFMTFGTMAQKGPKENRESKKAEVKASLNLTDEQSQAWDEIHESFHSEAEMLKGQEGLSDEERKKALKALKGEKRKAIQDLLTDEQENILNEERSNHRKERHQKHKEKMSDELNLTPEQEKQMKELDQRYHAQIKSVKEDNSLSDEEKKESIKNLRAEKKEVVKSLLSSEQQEKMNEIKSCKKKDKNCCKK